MFEFELGTFFWTIVNFLVLLFVVHKFALPSFFKMVDESEQKKQQVLDEIEQRSKESQRILTQYQEKMAAVQSEAAAIMQSARQESEQMKKQELEAMLMQKQQLLQSLRKEMDADQARFILTLKEELVDLVLLATKKLMVRELSKADQEKAIRDDIQEFAVLLKQ